MMERKYPFYLKSTVILFGLILFVYTIFYLREILIPVSFSLLLAILLNPLTNWFIRKKIPRVLSISLSLLLAFIVIAGIGYFLSSQIASFSDQLPLLKKNFLEMVAQIQSMVDKNLNIDVAKQNAWIAQEQKNIQPVIEQTLGTVVSVLAIMLLLPVYTFLLLFYKSLLLNFLYEVFPEKNSKAVGHVINETKGAVQNYMIGLLLEALIVAILNSVALLILGVKYAFLLGVIGALLNVLPYIGGIIAIALPMIIAAITGQGFHTQLGIIIAYLVIQFIDNHFLVPYIVSSKVKINALITIIIVLLGGAVWGVTGMFLSIPFIGVLKIIFDRVPELKPWGTLLGYEQPVSRPAIKKITFPGKRKTPSKN